MFLSLITFWILYLALPFLRLTPLGLLLRQHSAFLVILWLHVNGHLEVPLLRWLGGQEEAIPSFSLSSLPAFQFSPPILHSFLTSTSISPSKNKTQGKGECSALWHLPFQRQVSVKEGTGTCSCSVSISPNWSPTDSKGGNLLVLICPYLTEPTLKWFWIYHKIKAEAVASSHC